MLLRFRNHFVRKSASAGFAHIGAESDDDRVGGWREPRGVAGRIGREKLRRKRCRRDGQACKLEQISAGQRCGLTFCRAFAWVIFHVWFSPAARPCTISKKV